MLDKIKMSIPFKSEYVELSSDEKHSVLSFDVLDLGLKFGAYDVFKDEQGEVKTQVLRHAYTSLPTSHTGMAFKLFHETATYPRVELDCSPAKIMQGHNVYGSDWIEEGALEMLCYLQESQPYLYSMLDINSIEVLQLDATYSSRFKDNREAERVHEFMRGVTTQHIRKSTKQQIYKNTTYYGSERCKRFARKVYVKADEFANQLKEQIELAKRNDKCAARVVSVMSDPKLQAWAVGLLRFETGIKAYYLKEKNIPTNLWQLIRYQKSNPTFLKDIWIKSFSQLFKAFEGTQMKITDHETVFKNICSVHQTVSTTPKICTRKVDELMQFYLCLESKGANTTKLEYSHKRFLNLCADLIDAGFTGSRLQELHIHPLKNADHISVYAALMRKYAKIIPAGTVTNRRARNIMSFYDDLEKYGFEVIKSKYSKSQFNNLLKSLTECGYSRAFLQNLHVNSKNNVIPFIKMVEIDFANQLPPDFVEPKSIYHSRLLRIAS